MLSDDDMRSVLDDRCRRGMTRTGARQFDAKCVLRRLTDATGRDGEELLEELAQWAETANAKLEWQHQAQPGGRDRGSSELALLVLRGWF